MSVRRSSMQIVTLILIVVSLTLTIGYLIPFAWSAYVTTPYKVEDLEQRVELIEKLIHNSGGRK